MPAAVQGADRLSAAPPGHPRAGDGWPGSRIDRGVPTWGDPGLAAQRAIAALPEQIDRLRWESDLRWKAAGGFAGAPASYPQPGPFAFQLPGHGSLPPRGYQMAPGQVDYSRVAAGWDAAPLHSQAPYGGNGLIAASTYPGRAASASSEEAAAPEATAHSDGTAPHEADPSSVAEAHPAEPERDASPVEATRSGLGRLKVHLTKSPGARLGVTMQEDDQGIAILSVADGHLVANWNHQHPESAVSAGDHVVEANGITDKTQLLGLIQKELDLHLVLVKGTASSGGLPAPKAKAKAEPKKKKGKRWGFFG